MIVRRFVLFLSMALCIGVIPAAPAQAYIPQCGSGSNWFNGFSAFPNSGSPNNFEGAQAYITVRFGSVCDTDTSPVNNFTNAWTMIADSDGLGWAQSGFERGYAGGLYHFAQQYDGFSNLRTQYSVNTVPAGEVHRYWQQYDPACSCIHSNVDLTRFLSSTFNPFASWSRTRPWSPQFLGEARYRESDIAGRVSYPTSFTGMSVQRLDENWQPIPCPFLSGSSDEPNRWLFAARSCTSIDIWSR